MYTHTYQPTNVDMETYTNETKEKCTQTNRDKRKQAEAAENAARMPDVTDKRERDRPDIPEKTKQQRVDEDCKRIKRDQQIRQANELGKKSEGNTETLGYLSENVSPEFDKDKVNWIPRPEMSESTFNTPAFDKADFEQSVRFAKATNPDRKKSDLTRQQQEQTVYNANTLNHFFKKEVIDKWRDRTQNTWRVYDSDVKDVCFGCQRQYLFKLRTDFKEIIILVKFV